MIERKFLFRIGLVAGIPICAGLSCFLWPVHWIWAVVLLLLAAGFSGCELALVYYKPFSFEDTYTLKKRSFRRFVEPSTLPPVQNRLHDLKGELGIDARHKLHLTVHLVVHRTDCVDCQSEWWMVQLVNYVGERESGERRALPSYKGIIGRCFRSQAPQAVNFEAAGEYRKKMVEEFGFAVEEANYHATEAKSYICVPIGTGNGQIGVLYLYSITPNLFPDNAADFSKLDVLRSACGDIGAQLEQDRRARRAAFT